MPFGHFIYIPIYVFKFLIKFDYLQTEMENLTSRICWELVKKEGYIAIWRKPLNNSCYVNRDAGVKPPLCDLVDNPDSVWYFDFLIFDFDSFFYKFFRLI